MAVRPIVKYGHPMLHEPSEPVREIDGAIHKLLDDMVETMYAAPGIGLAAPQIAVPLRVIVVDLSVGEENGQLIKLINPEFVLREGEQRHDEGCLSGPVRVVFLGSGAFAVPSLEALLDAGHEVAAVVTQPDREKGRGRSLSATPAKVVAERRGVPVLQPRRIKEPAAIEELTALRPDV